jgi:hypothetical protein
MFIINIIDLVVLNLEISAHRLVLEEKPLHKGTSWRFPKDKLSVLNQALSRSYHECSLSVTLPLWNEHRVIIVKIFLQVFLSLTFPGFEQKDQRNDKCKVCPTNHYATLIYIQSWFLQNSSLGDILPKNISCHVATLWLSLPLRHAQFAK